MAIHAERQASIRILVTCLLANNLTVGLMGGSFGALLASNEAALGVGRSMISFGMSALTTAMGLTVLVVGNFTRRRAPSRTIATGLVIGAVAIAGLGLTTDIRLAILCWAMMGVSAGMSGILGPAAIAAEVFPGRAGRVLGIVNLPIALFASPLAVTVALPALGRDGTYLLMGAMLLPVAALALTLPRLSAATPAAPAMPDAARDEARMSLDRGFWLLSLGIAVIACTGATFMVHAMAFAQGAGLSGSQAAIMISLYSTAGLVGVPAFGWLADRITAARALAVAAAVQSLCWLALALAEPRFMFVLCIVLGAATTPLPALHGATMAQLFGTTGVNRAMGLSYAIKLPFFFVAAPAVGFAYQSFGSYRGAFIGVSIALALALALLIAGSAGKRAAARVPGAG